MVLSLKAQANYTFVSCSEGIKTTASIPSYILGEEASVTIKFRLTPPPFHQLKMKVSWTGEKRFESLNAHFTKVPRHYFISQIVESIRKERNKNYSFQEVGFNRFESIPWGFLRSQHFMALFLQADNLTLEAGIEGSTYDISTALANSARAMRLYIWNCHRASIGVRPTDGRSYLYEKSGKPVTRGKTAVAISVGYGLTNYGQLEKFLPQEFRGLSAPFPLGSSVPLEEQYSKFETIYDLVKIRRASLERMNPNIPSSFSKRGKSLVEDIRGLEQEWLRYLALDGDSTNQSKGRIERLEIEARRLKKQLALGEEELENLLSERNPLGQDIFFLVEALAPFEGLVRKIEGQIQIAKDRLQEFHRQQDEMVELLVRYQEWLGERERVSKNNPLTYVEIRDLEDNQGWIRTVGSLQDLSLKLEAALADPSLADLARVHSERSALYESYLEKESEYIGLRARFEKGNATLETIGRFDFLLENFDVLNQAMGQEIASVLGGDIPRMGELETEAIEELIIKNYDKLEEIIKETNASLLGKIACNRTHDEILEEHFLGDRHCLSPEDLSRDLEKVGFFAAIKDGRKLDGLIVAVAPDFVVNPWSFAETKASFLRRVAEEEVAKINELVVEPKVTDELLKIWTNIRFFKWALGLARKRIGTDPNYVFENTFYQGVQGKILKIYNAKSLEVLELEPKLEVVESESRDLRESAANMRIEYEIRTREFFDSHFIEIASVLDRANSYADSDFPLDFGNCKLPIAVPGKCEIVVSDGITTIEGLITEEDLKALEIVSHIVFSIEFHVEQSGENASLIEKEIQGLSSHLDLYVKRNGLEALREELNDLQSRLTYVTDRIAYLEDQANKIVKYQETNVQSLDIARTELDQILNRASELRTRIAEHEKVVGKVCSVTEGERKKIARANKGIFELLKPGVFRSEQIPYAFCGSSTNAFSFISIKDDQ